MAEIISFTFTVIDGKTPPQKSSVTIYANNLGADYTLAQLQSAATSMLPVIRNVLTGGIPKCSINFEPDFSALFASFPSLPIPDADSDVEEGATTHWYNEERHRPATKIRIPTFDETLLLSGTRIIDDADARFLALIDLMTEDILPSTVKATDSRGDSIAFYVDGDENFKRRAYKKRRK